MTVTYIGLHLNTSCTCLNFVHIQLQRLHTFYNFVLLSCVLILTLEVYFNLVGIKFVRACVPKSPSPLCCLGNQVSQKTLYKINTLINLHFGGLMRFLDHFNLFIQRMDGIFNYVSQSIIKKEKTAQSQVYTNQKPS